MYGKELIDKFLNCSKKKKIRSKQQFFKSFNYTLIVNTLYKNKQCHKNLAQCKNILSVIQRYNNGELLLNLRIVLNSF